MLFTQKNKKERAPKALTANVHQGSHNNNNNKNYILSQIDIKMMSNSLKMMVKRTELKRNAIPLSP